MDNASESQKKDAKMGKEKPLNELLTSSMVDIYVGPESHHWPLHERLLCYHSPFFQRIFYDKNSTHRSGSNKSYGLPDEDNDLPFTLLVGWLYSRSLKAPTSEKDIGKLLDLYLLANRFEMELLQEEVVDVVREWYHSSSTYPGLRRVQYIYAETNEDNQMREMMVSSVARQLATSDKIPAHWAKALQRNGQLAVDIIRAIQQWHIEERSIPDARDASADRGRIAKHGFSIVEEDRGESTTTVMTDGTEGNMGVQSIGSDSGADQSKGKEDGEEPPVLPERPDAEDKELVAISSDKLRTTSKRRLFGIPPSLVKSEFAFLGLAWLSYMLYNVFAWSRS